MSVFDDFINESKLFISHFRQGELRLAFGRVHRLIFAGLAVLLTLFAIFSLYKGYSSQANPTTFKIAVIGPESGSEKATWEYIVRGIKVAQSTVRVGKIVGQDLQIEYFDDAGNISATQVIANKICADRSYVLVMGFVESTVANQALPIYGKSDCGLPVILIATTSTNLTADNRPRWVAPILRLPPSNYQQAVQVVAALGDTFGTDQCRLLTFRDGDNKEYSDNMLGEFKNILAGDKRTHCIPSSQDDEIFQADRVEQTLTQKLSSKPNVDVILFFGMTDKAKQLLEALTKVRRNLHFPSTKPIVIISDGSTTTDLIDTAKENARCVWGSFPYGEPRDFKGNMPNDLANVPSYFAYGHDALVIAMHTISDVGEQVTRESIKKEFEKLAKEKEVLTGMNGTYEFASDGGLRFFMDVNDPNRVLGQYHLWQIRSPAGKLKWEHRRWRNSLEVGCEE